jgi:hypothetical protein
METGCPTMQNVIQKIVLPQASLFSRLRKLSVNVINGTWWSVAQRGRIIQMDYIVP